MAENKFSPKYLGKWIVYQPSYATPKQVNSLIVAHCYKETRKQIKCSESKNNVGRFCHERTVQKVEILGIIPEDKVEDVREHSHRLYTDYHKKADNTCTSFQSAMLNFPHRIKDD